MAGELCSVPKLNEASLYSLGMHMLSLGLENQMTVKGHILVLHPVNPHQGGRMAGLPKIREKPVSAQLAFHPEVPLFLNEGL